MERINVEEAAAGKINPLLLDSARVGSWVALDFLLKHDPPMMIRTEEFLALVASANRRTAAPDVDSGIDQEPASLAAGALLQGVLEADVGDIKPPLLLSARVGSWKALKLLFDREDPQDPPMVIAKGSVPVPVPAAPDSRQGVLRPVSLAARQLLKGVTPDGDSVLHVIATSGDDKDFLKYAGMICGRERGLLFLKNRNGETPLHCADRAGNSKMVSHLIDLAGRETSAGEINPPLLLSARAGSWKALKLLFDREDAQDPPMMIPTEEFLGSLVIAEEPAARDLEQGVPRPVSIAARQLLKGVTPDGDSVLHAVAGSGDGENFLKYAAMICGRDWDLLFTKNHNGDTPLHCAARAGNSKMASCLMALAGSARDDDGPDGKLTLLRMQNKRHETALHEAIRSEDGRLLGPEDRQALFQANRPTAEKIRDFVLQQKGMTIVKQLMGVDPQLANYPANGISPLYLAILLEKGTIALTLYQKSGGKLSYSGADGQNALHAALIRDRDTVMVELLLDWNKNLTMQVDKDGSAPLHFAPARNYWTGSILRIHLQRPYRYIFHWFPCTSSRTLEKVFKANPAALYQADKNGFFPIHVAASISARDAIGLFVRECPGSAGLRDAKGKTFLHVAIEKRILGLVYYACGNPSLASILNMQDNDGNTALHSAIQAGSLRMFCALFGNPEVNLNLTNNIGETPRDLSRSKLWRGIGYALNSENMICYALSSVGANHGALRRDKTEERYRGRTNPEDEDRESQRLKDATQSFIVASVLIATMAFTATFAIPGGYRADDRTNGGTPTLAGGFNFDAFIMATALAFICSLLATTGFMLAGMTIINLTTRRIYLATSEIAFSWSVTCISIVFGLGVYMVLAPVTRRTAVTICVNTPAILMIGKDMGYLFKMATLARPLCVRKGLFLGMLHLLEGIIFKMAFTLWPFLVIFGLPSCR